jgi:hypothetical protein
MGVEDVCPDSAAGEPARESDDPDPGAETGAWDGDGAGGDATEIVAAEIAAPDLAWSADDDDLEPSHSASVGRYVLAVAAVVLAAGAVIVTGSMLIEKIQRRPAVGAPATTVTTVTAPATQTTAALAATPAPISLPPSTPTASAQTVTPPTWDRDAIFFAMLANADIAPNAMKAPVDDAHSICGFLVTHTPADAATRTNRIYPWLTPAQSSAYVYAAIDAYCTQYENRGEY